MSKGFIFDYYKCVNCKACSAACILENQFTEQPRQVYTFNETASPLLEITHLSMACNHCGTPVCLEGCPVSAYYREQASGAVIINGDLCLGCKYCQWNCPYDAPKFNIEKKIIEKCNLCFTGFSEGRLPACATACPTGALDYGELDRTTIENRFPWFPDKNLNPAIGFVSGQINKPLRIIPEDIFKPENMASSENERSFNSEWSLLGFSFLSTLSVSMIISSFLKAVFPDTILFVILIILAGLISVFHLGKPVRAWRAVTNVRNSPLSREITVYIIYTALSVIAVLYKQQGFIVASSIAGIILLFSIDAVYFYSGERKSAVFHSGQTILSALLIISFLNGLFLPFIFIALIRLSLSVYRISENKKDNLIFVIRFIRIAILLIAGASLISNISYADPSIAILFLAGELIDRYLFYIDFEPLNINTLISKQINASGNEKKRD
jgi:Fe-S-cluster-containing dehydrogenase component/DMSO reductase anchor subunit